MFDSNAMHELAALSRDRYQRAGGGGAFNVYATSQAYYDARGHKELSPFARACVEILHRYRQVCEVHRAHFEQDCLTSKGGFYHGDSIPFAEMAQRRADAPLKPKTAQRPCDAGLFGDSANQQELKL